MVESLMEPLRWACNSIFGKSVQKVNCSRVYNPSVPTISLDFENLRILLFRLRCTWYNKGYCIPSPSSSPSPSPCHWQLRWVSPPKLQVWLYFGHFIPYNIKVAFFHLYIFSLFTFSSILTADSYLLWQWLVVCLNTSIIWQFRTATCSYFSRKCFAFKLYSLCTSL